MWLNGYYRIMQPFDYLPKDNFQVSYAMGGTQAHTSRPDIIIGQRVMQAPVSIIWHMLAKGRDTPWFKARGENGERVKIVFETDDDWFSATDHIGKRAYDFYSDKDAQKRLADNMRIADALIVSTPTLAHRLRNYNEHIYVLPNYVEGKLWDSPPVDQDPSDNRIIIGWGGGWSHKYDFAEVEPYLVKIMRAYPNVWVKFNTVAHITPDLRATGRVIHRKGWLDTLEYTLAHDYHIGLAPLEHNLFNSSKSHIRALEYAARGIPCIASDLPPYNRFIQHGTTGFLAKVPSRHWYDYMDTLISAQGIRYEMAEAARAYAVQWTIENNIHRHAEVYRKIMDQK